MDIEKRLQVCNQQFEAKNKERDQHIQIAEECLVEMTKLQGEYRLLQSIKDESEPDSNPKKANKKPTVIDAIPEPVGK